MPTSHTSSEQHFTAPAGAAWDLRGAARLIAVDVNYAREVLLATARRDGFVCGCAPTNLRQIANDLAFVALSEAGLDVAGDIQIADLIERAVAAVAARRAPGDAFAQLAGRPGFLRVLRDSVLEARMAGVSGATLRRGASRAGATSDLAEVLDAYERLLAADGLADPAAVFSMALAAFDAEADYVLRGETAMVEGLSARGLPGELMSRLERRGVRLLRRPAANPGSAVDPRVTTCDLFAAASASDELREVCRRVVAENLRWDQVEIVATDPDEYGTALDALAEQLGVRATMLRGVPLARTRLGRAVERWLGWIENGLPADTLRESLEAGEMHLPDADVTSTALARELRLASIGWGRARYEGAVAALRRGDAVAVMRQRDDEPDAEFATRKHARARVCSALAEFLERLLATTPAVPARGSDAQVPATAPGLARALLGCLELVPVHGQAQEQTMQRLRGRLEQLAVLASEPTTFPAAVAAVRDLLADVRAWPMQVAERKPWSSSGGMLHLTDVAHAGATGRPRIFVVGLDADRTAGPVRENPLLSDAARRATGVSGLPTSAERREEWEASLATALAGLRGRVTLSYATSVSLDGREASPSPLLLDVWRAMREEPSLTYRDLRQALYPPASPVPAGAHESHVDARDVWLGALADGPLLIDGSAAVAQAFPGLAAGLRARDQARLPRASEFHGVVPEAGPVLDPLAGGRPVSPSALETQAACALKWFYKYGLGIEAPDDPEYDPDKWLDALARGSLLHGVYEAFTREYAGKQETLAQPAARDSILAIADAAIVRWREVLPPPSESVFEAQSAELRTAALAFLQMERERWADGDRGLWSRFELRFGWENPPGPYVLPDGAVLRIKGRADRVDAMPDGTLRVVDYKTGNSRGYGNDPKAGPFDGGRRLQPALYVPAVAAAEAREVSRFEYRFPTERGQNEVITYGAAALEPARAIIADLLAQLRAGEFVPTDDARDCAYCDYQAICRASRDDQTTVSPRAAWADANGAALPEYVKIVARRARAGRRADDGEDSE